MARLAFCFHHAEPSGATLWLVRFLENADLARHEIACLMPGPSPLEDRLRAKGFAVEIMTIAQRSLGAASVSGKLALLSNRVRAVGQYQDFFRRWRADLATVNSSVQIAPMLAARRARVPLVVHVHEAWARSRTFPLKKWAVRRWADGAVFASRAGIDFFGGEPAGRRWLFSPNGVDGGLAALRSRRAQLRAGLGIAEGAPLLLFVGTLQALKGVQDLLAAWPAIRRQHPAATLILAGAVSEEDRHPAIDDFLRNGLEGVRHLGYRSDATELIAAADVLLLPSHAEAMPLAVVEAMMAGTPVVARDVGDVGWLLDGGRGVVLPSGEPAAIAAGVDAALTSGAAMAASAQAFAMESLTREKQNKEIVAFLEGFVRTTG